MTGSPADYLKRNLERQNRFFRNQEGHLLVFAGYSDNRAANIYPIEGQTRTLSESFLRQNAFALGIQAVRRAQATAENHAVIGDDLCPGVHIDWGVGVTTVLVTGGKVIFEEGTTYTDGPLLKSWDDLGRLKFDSGNRWIGYALDFWRGVESEYMEGIAVSPNVFRSPLDLANDLRGNVIFMDLYDHPENVETLTAFCAESIIALDRLFRREIRVLRDAPGGIWGVALPLPGMVFLNGDPVDLISEEMGRRFNNPPVEKVAAYAGSLYLHHHSIGHAKAPVVSEIKGLTVQEILQDPNGPRLHEVITDELIAASRKAPIHLSVDVAQWPRRDDLIRRLAAGRFIIEIFAATPAECRQLMDQIRRLA